MQPHHFQVAPFLDFQPFLVASEFGSSCKRRNLRITSAGPLICTPQTAFTHGKRYTIIRIHGNINSSRLSSCCSIQSCSGTSKMLTRKTKLSESRKRWLARTPRTRSRWEMNDTWQNSWTCPEAKENENKQKTMLGRGAQNVSQSCRLSIVLSSALIMEGYDLNPIASFYAFPSFNKKYGYYDAGSDSYQLWHQMAKPPEYVCQCGRDHWLFAAGIAADRIKLQMDTGSLLLVIADFSLFSLPWVSECWSLSYY